MKARLGTNRDPFFEFLFQLFKSLPFFVIKQVGNLWVNGHRRLGSVDVKHLSPQFSEYFMTDRYFRLYVAAPLAVAARLTHHAADILAERILTPGDWLHNVHVEATKAAVCQDTPGIGKIYAARTPGFLGFSEDDLRPAPDIGADSREVLLDAGFASDAIDSLINAGIVRIAPR